MSVLGPAASGATRGAPHAGLRVVITGKGGVGKTTVSALLARLLARDGRRVLAVDADAQLNLAAALGIPTAEAEALVPLGRDADYVAEKTGARPGEGWGVLFRLNPDVDDVVERFGRLAPDDVRLLAIGTLTAAGTGCLCPEHTLLAETIRRIGLRAGEAIVMDTQAGVEHFGRAIASGFGHAVVMTDPTYGGVGVALSAARHAAELGIPSIHLVVNRVSGEGDLERVDAYLAARDAPPFTSRTWLPADPRILAAEPSVGPLLDAALPVVAAVGRLRERLTAGSPKAEPAASAAAPAERQIPWTS